MADSITLTPTGANAVAATGGYDGFNDGTAAVPGRSGPFKNFLLPGMGDSRRFDAAPIRVSSGWAEAQLGRYDVNPGARGNGNLNPGAGGSYGGPVLRSGVNSELEGFSQDLDALAATVSGTLHEVVLMKSPKYWINAIKNEGFKPFNGWESRLTIFRGGMLHQSGLANWRRILPVPEAGINHPSNLPGFQTYGVTTEELRGTGYETGWGSDLINIDHLRNTPNAAQTIKQILDVGVEQGVRIRESYFRETYTQLACTAHRGFVMSADCVCEEDMGARTFIYDPHVACDAFMDGSDIKALVDDRTDPTNAAKTEQVLDGTTMVDNYGQYHAMKDLVTDPSTGLPAPFMIVCAGEKNSVSEIETPNWDMLERLRESLDQRLNGEGAVGRDGDVPIYAIMFKTDDVDKSIRANPAEWRAYLEAQPMSLITHYGLSKAKTYRRWAIVNDANQLRFKILRYIPEYTSAIAKNYGYVGYRNGDDPSLQGKAVYVCVVVNPLIASATRKGTNGTPVPMPNPEYRNAPLALANVFIRDTFVNQVEGAPSQIGHGTNFGPFPQFNGDWGFLNIRDRSNPFGVEGNFYGLFRYHLRPTKYTQEACCFVYTRDTQVFKANIQAEHKVINQDYTGDVQTVKVSGGGEAPSVAASAATVAVGETFALTLEKTPHLALANGSKAKLVTTEAATAGAEVVVVDNSLWPKVVFAPLATLTLADVNLDADAAGSLVVDGDLFVQGV